MFLKAEYLAAFLDIGLRRHRPTKEQRAYTALLLSVWVLLRSVITGGQLLDRLLYRSLQDFTGRDPLYIVATPRSGTTYMFHLLSLDTNRFTRQKLYETLLPAASLQRALNRAIEVARQKKAGRPLLKQFDKQIFPSWEHIHSVRLGQAEEDEAFFVLTMTSPALYIFFPYVDELPELSDIDASLSEDEHEKVAAEYRDLIERYGFASKTERTPLIKCVLGAGRMKLMQRAFPSARFVHMVRHPFEAIPAAVSMFYALIETHSNIPKDSEECRALARMFVRHYRMLYEHSLALGDRAVTVRYEDFVRDPIATVRRVYDALGLDFSESYERKLERSVEQARRFRSRHYYVPEDFGLSKDEIHQELADCFEAYGYRRDDEPQTSEDARRRASG